MSICDFDEGLLTSGTETQTFFSTSALSPIRGPNKLNLAGRDCVIKPYLFHALTVFAKKLSNAVLEICKNPANVDLEMQIWHLISP